MSKEGSTAADSLLCVMITVLLAFLCLAVYRCEANYALSLQEMRQESEEHLRAAFRSLPPCNGCVKAIP